MAGFKLIRDARNIISGILIGFSMSSWLMLFYFNDKWKAAVHRVPTGEFIYAHVEHGGLAYFSAMQSVVSHLYLPVWLCFPIALLLSTKKNTQKKFLRITWEHDDPYNLMAIAWIASALAMPILIYFHGHALIQFLIDHGLKPSSDSLDFVDHS